MKNLLMPLMCITLSGMVLLSACGLVGSYPHRELALLDCETDMECEMVTGIKY